MHNISIFVEEFGCNNHKCGIIQYCRMTSSLLWQSEMTGINVTYTAEDKNILEKWFPLQGELAKSFYKFYVCTLVKNKIERGERRRQNKNRPINYHKVITLSTYYVYTTSP